MQKSSGIVDKGVGRGQSIKSAYPMDNTSDPTLPDERGGSFGGSVDNLEHSIKGAKESMAPGESDAGVNSGRE